ncbi:hypothetical protein WI97_17165 [Burkholderia vietnamiensis]|nr:hypothetical protein WI97_17165 [Burkholderia vietnamiensis]
MVAGACLRRCFGCLQWRTAAHANGASSACDDGGDGARPHACAGASLAAATEAVARGRAHARAPVLRLRAATEAMAYGGRAHASALRSHARNRAPTASQRRASTTPTSASANPASWTAASVSPNSR